jgi:hypothetical protein
VANVTIHKKFLSHHCLEIKMPLSFVTTNQQFVFVDPSSTPPATVNPEAVLPNHLYDVYVVIENTDTTEALDVQVDVSHTAFGIGRMAGTDGLTQPAPVTVPPSAYGIPGTATVAFTFLTPPGGHGCLGAVIVSSGAYIGQNVTVTTCPSGVASQLSFVVFGGAATEAMVLTLTESVQGGALIPAGSPDSWQPLMIAPPGTGPSVPTASPVTLNLVPEAFYSVGLQVTIPPGATESHVFQIVGTVAGQFEGEVDIVVNPVAGLVAPDPYLAGGYQSPDILIFDSTNTLVPLGGMPNGRWDTLLIPNTNYKVSAVVHNDSTTPAVNTVVRFWSIPGGIASNGTLLSVVTATVPANGSVQVDSSVPYRSAPAGEHRCVAVSIYNSQATDATVDPVTASQIPSPSADITHSASAWRNTDSMFVFPGKPWHLALQGTVPIDRKVPVRVKVTATLAPSGLETTPAATTILKTLQEAGARPSLPLFLIPSVRETLPAVDLKIKVGDSRRLSPTTAEFPISGVVPEDAKAGDRYVVLVSAEYGEDTVEFLEALYVQAG